MDKIGLLESIIGFLLLIGFCISIGATFLGILFAVFFMSDPSPFFQSALIGLLLLFIGIILSLFSNGYKVENDDKNKED